MNLLKKLNQAAIGLRIKIIINLICIPIGIYLTYYNVIHHHPIGMLLALYGFIHGIYYGIYNLTIIYYNFLNLK